MSAPCATEHSLGPMQRCVHYSKCGGVPFRDLPHVCEICSRGFATRVGLSQHKRHMHPEVKLVKRQVDAVAGRGRGQGRRVWSEEEERMGIDDRWPNGLGRGYAQRMSAFLPGKTLKQIREKVRCMRNDFLMPNTDPAQVDEQVSEDGSSLRSSVHSEAAGHEDTDRASSASPASHGELGEVREEAPEWDDKCGVGPSNDIRWAPTTACLVNSNGPRTSRRRYAIC